MDELEHQERRRSSRIIALEGKREKETAANINEVKRKETIDLDDYFICESESESDYDEDDEIKKKKGRKYKTLEQLMSLTQPVQEEQYPEIGSTSKTHGGENIETHSTGLENEKRDKSLCAEDNDAPEPNTQSNNSTENYHKESLQLFVGQQGPAPQNVAAKKLEDLNCSQLLKGETSTPSLANVLAHTQITEPTVQTDVAQSQEAVIFQQLLNDDTPIPYHFDNASETQITHNLESTIAQTHHAVAQLEALKFQQILNDDTTTPEFEPTTAETNAARELVQEAAKFEQLSNNETDPTLNLLPNFGKTDDTTEVVETPITEAARRLEFEQFMLILNSGTPQATTQSQVLHNILASTNAQQNRNSNSVNINEGVFYMGKKLSVEDGWDVCAAAALLNSVYSYNNKRETNKGLNCKNPMVFSPNENASSLQQNRVVQLGGRRRQNNNNSAGITPQFLNKHAGSSSKVGSSSTHVRVLPTRVISGPKTELQLFPMHNSENPIDSNMKVVAESMMRKNTSESQVGNFSRWANSDNSLFGLEQVFNYEQPFPGQQPESLSGLELKPSRSSYMEERWVRKRDPSQPEEEEEEEEEEDGNGEVNWNLEEEENDDFGFWGENDQEPNLDLQL